VLPRAPALVRQDEPHPAKPTPIGTRGTVHAPLCRCSEVQVKRNMELAKRSDDYTKGGRVSAFAPSQPR